MSPSDTPSRSRRFLGAWHRFSRRAATAVILLVFLALTFAVVLWMTGGGYLSAQGADLLNARVFAPGTRIVVDRVSGFPLDHLILTGVRLERETPEGWTAIATAGRVRIAYDLWGLLHGRYLASRVDVGGLEVDLRSTPDGLFLPQIRAKPPGPARRAPPISIRRVVLADGAVRLGLPWRTLAADSLHGEFSFAVDRGLTLEIARLNGRAGAGIGELAVTRGTVTVGDRVELDGLAGTLGGSPFTLDGPVAGEPLALDATIENFDLGRLGRFLGEEVLAKGHVARAAGEIRAGPGGITFTVSGAARWDTWVADELLGRGTVSGGVLRLDGVRVLSEGTEIADATVVVPLHARDVRVTGRITNLTAPLLRVPAFADVPGFVNGVADVHIRDRDDLFANTTIRARLESGRLYDIPFGQGTTVLRAVGDLWYVDTLSVHLADADVSGRGTVTKTRLDLDFSYNGSLQPWRELVRQEDLAGTGRLRVHLHGPSRNPEMDVRGEVRDLAVARIEADLVTLKEARGTVMEDRRFRLRFTAPDGVVILGSPFSRAEGEILVAGDGLEMERLRLDRGDTTVTASGSMTWKPDVRIHLDQAEAVLDGRRFWIESPGTIVRRGETFVTDGLLVHTPRGDLEVAGGYDRAGKNLFGEARLLGIDPSVFFPLSRPPAVAVGRMTGTVVLERTEPALRGHADLGLREVDWKGGHLDSVAARVGVDGRTVLVEHLEPRLAGGSFRVSGEVRLPESVPDAFRRLRARGAPDSSRTEWDLDVLASQIDLAAWRFLLPGPERPAGRVDARIQVGGTSARPRLEVSGRAVSLSWRGFDVDTMVVDASYADGNAVFRSLETWQGNQKLVAGGTVPVDLVLLPYHGRLADREMDAFVRANDSNLESLKLTPWIREASGDLDAQIRFRGTPRHPLLDGRATVANGRVSLDERDEVVSEITARIRFDRDLVIVEEARGKVTIGWAADRVAGGWATASGTYRLGADESRSYELDVRFTDAVVGDEGTYAARVSGEVKLRPFVAADGRVFPRATGAITADLVQYQGSLRPQDIGPLKPPTILYDVTVSAPSRILLSTQDIEAELGGELSVRREPERQIILGSLAVHEGSYRFFEKIFRVTRGTLTWDSPATRLPNLDITAETKEAGYLIEVLLTGRPTEPVLTFSATSLNSGDDAGLSQAQIVQLLATGAIGLSAGAAGAENDQTAQFLLGAGSLFSDQLERQILREFGFNVAIESEEDVEGEIVPTVGVRRYLSTEVSLRVQQSLGSQFEQTVGVEYRLGRLFFLRGAVIHLPKEQKEEYNLDLQFRREY